jgi:hypothetical protein
MGPVEPVMILKLKDLNLVKIPRNVKLLSCSAPQFHQLKQLYKDQLGIKSDIFLKVQIHGMLQQMILEALIILENQQILKKSGPSHTQVIFSTNSYL